MGRWFRNAKGEVRSGWKAAGYFLVLAVIVLLVNVLAKGLVRVYGPAVKAAISKVGPVLPALMALGASALCLHLERRPLASIGLRFDRRWLGEFALGTAGGVALLVAVALAIRATGAFHWERNAAWGAGQLLRGAWIYLWAASVEELVFRGYPFQRLLQGGLGPNLTLALFALFFGVAHWGNPGLAGTAKVWATLNIALAAVLLGLAWLRTGSLALPIGLHLG
jgi:membrane protease YdiL (CAAX protease family)